MKEATGELNMTVVIAVIVASLAAFFYIIVWPLIRDNFDKNSKCSNAVCVCKKGHEDDCLKNGAECHVPGNKGNTFTCPWKG